MKRGTLEIEGSGQRPSPKQGEKLHPSIDANSQVQRKAERALLG